MPIHFGQFLPCRHRVWVFSGVLRLFFACPLTFISLSEDDSSSSALGVMVALILGCQEQILCRPPELGFEGHTAALLAGGVSRTVEDDDSLSC